MKCIHGHSAAERGHHRRRDRGRGAITSSAARPSRSSISAFALVPEGAGGFFPRVSVEENLLLAPSAPGAGEDQIQSRFLYEGSSRASPSGGCSSRAR